MRPSLFPELEPAWRPAKPGRRRPIEQTFHIDVARFLRWAVPKPVVWFHPPNGGARGKAEAGLLKMMGVKPGVPDLVFVFPGGIVGFIELKPGKDGSLSVDQREFRDACYSLGARWACCRTLDRVVEVLDGWLAEYGLALKARIAA